MKITKRIDDPTPKKTDEVIGSGFNLSRRIDDTPSSASNPIIPQPVPFPLPPAIIHANDWAAVAYRLTGLVGADVIERIRHYPLLQIAYLSDDISGQEWFMEGLKILLKLDDVQDIRQNLDKAMGNMENSIAQLHQVCQDKMQENEQLRTQSRQLSEKIEELDVLRQRSNRLLKTRVSIDKVLDLVFNTDDPTEQLLVQLLKDDLSATPDELGAFMLALASAWNGLKATISSLPTPAESNEEQRLLRVGVALTHLLAQLSGLYIPARRGVLNTVAQYASASMAHYVFVSPEETRTVNPSIHKTDALGGSIIAEGVTFAVLRRDTRQTIRYAEVKVEKP